MHVSQCIYASHACVARVEWAPHPHQFPAMASASSADDARPTGPAQEGRGVQGQYMYWVCVAHSKSETVQRLGLKVPSDFTREEFGELMVKAHKDMKINVVETVCFLEPHENGLKHHNCLPRASSQFRWRKPADHLRDQFKVCVSVLLIGSRRSLFMSGGDASRPSAAWSDCMRILASTFETLFAKLHRSQKTIFLLVFLMYCGARLLQQ